MPFTPGKPVAQAQADLFKAMAHPGRIRVLELLIDGDQSVSDLSRQTGMEMSHISHQIAILRQAGLVTSARNKNTVVCSLGDPQIAYLLNVARDLLANHLRNTRELLKALQDLDRPISESESNVPG